MYIYIYIYISCYINIYYIMLYYIIQTNFKSNEASLLKFCIFEASEKKNAKNYIS